MRDLSSLVAAIIIYVALFFTLPVAPAFSAQTDAASLNAYQKGKLLYEKADYDRAIVLEPESADHYINRGYVLYTVKSDTTRACSDWKWACELGECSYYEKIKGAPGCGS